jgi:UDP-2,3-diacylglucosamine pyrophosphatase LpxH
MRTLIISDLHLGNGGPYDVFEGAEALPALLDGMSDAPLRVLVNGDGVDFLMNDDPLELDPARAVEQARAIVANPASAAVFRAFGRVLARGGEVSIRLGNHDVELAFPEVQAVLRGALGQPASVAARLAVVTGEAPEILEIGGARVLVTHGEQDDRWNKVDYKKLAAEDKRYPYAPGSVLVKKILNPGTGVHGMRFLSLLKPDFQGAALAALAVDATVAKQLFKGATLSMLLDLLRRKGMKHTFDAAFDEEEGQPSLSVGEGQGAPPPEGGEQGEAPLLSRSDLARRLDGALLDEEECEAIEALLDDNVIASFEDDGAALESASVKIARAALGIYARLHRRLTGKEGDEYFVLEPTQAEWTEAQRLAEKFNAGAVIIGHTHAARWKLDKGLLYANTGTWIGLMQLPRSDAGDEEWLRFLHELKQNKRLDPKAQKHAKIFTRFTAVLVEPHEDGGAALSLVEWKSGALKTLGAGRVPQRMDRS